MTEQVKQGDVILIQYENPINNFYAYVEEVDGDNLNIKPLTNKFKINKRRKVDRPFNPSNVGVEIQVVKTGVTIEEVM